MDLSTAFVMLKLSHVLLAIWLFSGLIGRWVVLEWARGAQDVRITQTLLNLAGRFENLMVIPGSIALLVSGLLTAWIVGLPVFGVLQGARTNWILVSLVLYFTLVPVIIFIFVPRGRVFGAALADAVAQGQVTEALRQAFADPVVRAAHWYEIGVIVLIVGLMVAKPF